MKQISQVPKKYKPLITVLTIIILIIIAVLFFTNESFRGIVEEFYYGEDTQQNISDVQVSTPSEFDLSEIPEYTGNPYCTVNGGDPFFEENEITDVSFESYSPLDSLGRCGTALACIGKDLMPTEKRESIGHIKPSGWQSVQYDHVDGKSLYNRCHLIGFQLAGENDNEKNLITGTRYMNVDGMLPFENMIADYVKETDNHVMFRVTPVFKESELVARGVLMEAYSVEDGGDGVSFNVFVYNVQPMVEIDYSNGDSREVKSSAGENSVLYILNTSSKKFHSESCSLAADISDKNKGEFEGTRDELISMGYDPCGYCKP